MFCKTCSAELNENDKFCPYCGASTKDGMDETPAVPPVETQTPPAPVATMVAPKKRKSGLIVGIAAVLAVAVLISAIFLGGSLFGNKDNDPTLSSSSSSSLPADDPVKLVITPAELVYEMTDADFEKFYDLLEQCQTAALGNQDGDTVMAISDEIDDHYAYMDAQLSIATVLYYSDLTDEDASQLYLDVTEALTDAYDAYMEMAKALYAAEFTAKDRFFEEWSDEDLAYLAAYTSEVAQLRQRNSEITVAYQDLQNDPEMYDKMVPLYIEMVQNNNRLAQIFGYANYYEYAYSQVYERDYSLDEIATMRNLVATYLPNTINNALDVLRTGMNNLSTAQRTQLNSFMYDPFEYGYIDELERYFATLPQSARDTMLDMFDGDIVLMNSVMDAQEGAFTTAVGTDRYICFFGPGYASTSTAIHEVGHYYGCQFTDLGDLPMDLAEIQSQGNEWLFMSYMQDEMAAKLYNVAVNYNMYQNLCTILISVLVDEFEHQVYTHPNIASLTGDDLDAIMADVCDNYGGITFISNVATDIQTYWRMVVVEQPVYYISYGVSAISAVNIFTIADENYEEAVEIYCSLIEELDLEEGFLGNIQSAGLDGPFDDEVYVKLQAMYG